MGLLQKAVETYDNMAAFVGEYEENKEPLAPVGYISAAAAIEITIDQNGCFVNASEVKDKIIIPVTQESAGRTSGACAHPLFDNLGYLSSMDEQKHNLYVTGLKEWVDSDYCHPALLPVYNYVTGGTIIGDLESCGLIEKDDKGAVKNEKDLVRWVIIGISDSPLQLWKDKELMERYRQFYESRISGEDNDYCMITGAPAPVASQHIKGVVALNGNAKLISANDRENFTYRGRFIDDRQAACVSYEASQKAHNALKWIAANEGVYAGSRCFICWNPKGIRVPQPHYNFLQKKGAEKIKPSDYGEFLRKEINGFREQIPKGESVVIAGFDAATTGRLAVTYYNELQGSDYLDRLQYWNETCCWVDRRSEMWSPLLNSIVHIAFGTLRESASAKAKFPRFEADAKILGQQVQRLYACRLDKAKFPRDIMLAVARKADNLQVLGETAEDGFLRDTVLSTACAVIRKFRIDNFKEEWSLALETQNPDRSYQYGRLLAVLEKAERDTYDKDEKRETNAIRMQSVFVKRPAWAAAELVEKLKAGYYPRLQKPSKDFYERLIGQIMEVINSSGESEYNKPLSETYLMGYYLQKNALYAKKDNGNADNNEENTEEENNG